jgi:hypothetical protein
MVYLLAHGMNQMWKGTLIPSHMLNFSNTQAEASYKCVEKLAVAKIQTPDP